MTEEELRHWLNRAFYADKKAKALDALAQQCRERAQGLSGCGECNDKGKSDTAVNGTENALMKLAEIEHKALVLRLECADILSEILTAIWTLKDDDLEAVLMNRYALFYTVEQTAEVMHYSPRTVKLKTKIAIQKLCPSLPCIAPNKVL